jgi:predicted RNase H-like HicB family nuclease
VYRFKWIGASYLGRIGVPLVVKVSASFDKEAGVYVATSSDLPGLVVEAATLDELNLELRELVPAMISLCETRAPAPIRTQVTYSDALAYA